MEKNHNSGNILGERGVITIEGEQAKEFLQGLITNNISKLPIYSLMLTPHGKFLYDFFISEQSNILYVDCYYTSIEQIIKTLNIYKLRSKIEIIDKTLEFNVVSSKEAINGAIISYQDPRLEKLGYRSIVPKSLVIDESNFSYESLRIQCGVPEGHKDMLQNKSFPLEFSMDKLNAIDFDKGCYLGQEVTSRTKYLGTIRKKPYIIKGKDLPQIGHDILAGDQKIGLMCSSNSSTGIALIRQDDYEKLAQKNLPFDLTETNF